MNRQSRKWWGGLEMAVREWDGSMIGKGSAPLYEPIQPLGA